MPASSIDLADAAVTPALLLDEVRRARAAADEAERTVLGLAAVWADAHPDFDEHGEQRWWKAPKTKPVDEMMDDALTDGGPQTTDVEEFEWYGIPGIAWGAAASFAAANNQPTTGGKTLIRDTLILRHRLPRTWEQTMAGAAPAWRARRVAQAVVGAPADVTEFVDDQIADKIGVLSLAQLARLLQEAMVRLHAEKVEAESIEALDACHVTLHPSTLNQAGVVDMSVRGEWADLVEFDATVARIAAALATTDHPRAADSTDIRRAAALGVLADPAAAAALLDHTTHTDPTTEPDLADRLPGTAPVDPVAYEPAHDEDHDGGPEDVQDAEDAKGTGEPERYDPPDHDNVEGEVSTELEAISPSPTSLSTARRGASRGAGRGRDVMLYLHLTDTALLGYNPLAHDDHGRVFLADTVAAWCGRPGLNITVRPVIDLNQTHHRAHDGPDSSPDNGSDPPDNGKISPALAEKVSLHDPTCVYPWCTRPARRCDKDHLLAHAAGGPTCQCNLAPLCRQHHQLKTHAGWTYERLTAGHYLWRDPHGLHYLHTPHGTRPLNGDPPAGHRVRCTRPSSQTGPSDS